MSSLAYTLRKNGASYEADFYHNDHLATPQKLTNSTGVASWAMESNAFGEVTIKTQTTPNNLRFPGQYADSEIGLSQNYHRDYVPNLGRYIETDPIGLRGGVNTYSYVQSNPLFFYDPEGLLHGNLNDPYYPFRQLCKAFGGCGGPPNPRVEAIARIFKKCGDFVYCEAKCVFKAVTSIDLDAGVEENIGNLSRKGAEDVMKAKAQWYANLAVEHFDKTGKILGKKIALKVVPVAGQLYTAYQVIECSVKRCG